MDDQAIIKAVIAAIIAALGFAAVAFRDRYAKHRKENPSAQRSLDKVTWVVIVVAGLCVLAVIVYASFAPP